MLRMDCRVLAEAQQNDRAIANLRKASKQEWGRGGFVGAVAAFLFPCYRGHGTIWLHYCWPDSWPLAMETGVR